MNYLISFEEYKYTKLNEGILGTLSTFIGSTLLGILIGLGITTVSFFALVGTVGVYKVIRRMFSNSAVIKQTYSDTEDFWDDFDVVTGNETEKLIAAWEDEISNFYVKFKTTHQSIGLDPNSDGITRNDINLIKENDLYKDYTAGLEKISKKYENSIEKIIKQKLTPDRANKMITVINDPKFKNQFIKATGI